MPQTTTVSTAAQLTTALKSAASGDTIVLKSGNYGALDLTGLTPTGNVTVKAESSLGADFTSIKLTNVDNLTFSGIEVAGEFRAVDGSSGVQLLNSDVNGGAYFKDADTITLKGNDITTTGANAVIFNSVDTVKVVGNTIHDAGVDLVRVSGDSADVRIASNYLFDVHAQAGESPDLVQLFGYDGHSPTNVRIVDNIMYDDPKTGAVAARGVEVAAPAADGYKDVLVSGNTVATTAADGVIVDGGTQNVLVTGNTLSTIGGVGGAISVTEASGLSDRGTTVQGNTAVKFIDSTTSLSTGVHFDGNKVASVAYVHPVGSDASPAPTTPAPTVPTTPAPTVPPATTPTPTKPATGDVTVSTAAQLTAALKAATAGETIVLKAGNYGALNLNGTSFTGDVKLVSETPNGAKFGNVTLSNVDHLSFNGISVTGEFKATNGSTFVSLLNSSVKGDAYFMDATNIVVTGNDIDGQAKAMNTLTFNDVSNVQVLDNVVHDARSDILRITGDSHNYVVSRNQLLDTHPQNGDHPDLVSTMAIDGVTPTDLTFTQNVLYDDPATGPDDSPGQGFFISLPAADGYKNILIEDNLVASPSVNSIFINGGKTNVVVRDNIVATAGGGGTIRIVEMNGVSNSGTVVEHNVARQLLNETTGMSSGLKIGTNIFKTVPVADLLADWTGHVDASFVDVPHIGLTMADLTA